jgi:hypothetical protein
MLNISWGNENLNRLDPNKWIGLAPYSKVNGISLEKHPVFLKNLKNISPVAKFNYIIHSIKTWSSSDLEKKDNVIYFSHCEPHICSHNLIFFLDANSAEMMFCEAGIFDDPKINDKDVFWYGNPKSLSLISFKKKYSKCTPLEM